MHIKTALVVDDSRVARMTLGKLLKAQDFELTELGSGEEAVSWLQSAEQEPDIIFMDVMMDGMDGLTATRQIKSNPRLAGIPVVICTGNESEADLDKALATGAVAVLSKPPAAEALTAVLNDVTSRLETADISAEAEKETPVAAGIDEQALFAKLMQSVQEQFLPDLHRQMRETAEDISRQVAEQTAAEASNKHGQSLIMEITRQVSEAAQSSIQELKDGLSVQAQELVSRTAAQAVEKALQDYGLTEKLMATLRSEGAEWLKKQQQPLRDAVQQQLQDDLTPTIDRYLEQQLNARIQPLVKSQLGDVQAELENKQQDQLSQLQAQLTLQRNISFGAAGVAVLALIIAFI